MTRSARSCATRTRSAPRPRSSGQAYVTAYALMDTNREGIEQIADVLVDRKEIHGDEVGELLDSVGLTRPELDLTDPDTWPKV